MTVTRWRKSNFAQLDFIEETTPDTPESDTRRVFVDPTTGELSVVTDAGVVVSLEAPDLSAFVDQDVTVTGSPTFAGLTIINPITEFSIDGTLGDDSDLALPTEKAVKTYVDAQIGTVNSLAEVLALGNKTGGANVLATLGTDIIIYSDDGITEVARIDGLTGNISTLGTLSMAPTGTGSQNIINLAPSANLVAGSTWIGQNIDIQALDPATGAISTVESFHLTATTFASTDGNAIVVGFDFDPPLADLSMMLYHELGKMTDDKQQWIIRSYNIGALPSTATYRGLHLDWDALTSAGGGIAPIMRGVIIEMPADFTNFGIATYAAYFSGDGRTVTICDTSYALDISGAMNLVGAITGVTSLNMGNDLTVGGNIIVTGNVDGVDVSAFKVAYDAHVHDAQTLQLDGVNSNGGAFSFSTTGLVTFNQAVTIQGLATVDGLNPEADVSDALGSADLTWLDIFVQNFKDASGTVCALTNSGYLETNKLFVDRQNHAASGIQWYNIATYTTWVEYMSNPAINVGPTGTLTAPSGTIVTSWALRSFIENSAGYGWTWESGTPATDTTPTVVFEIASADGSFKSFGNGTIIGTLNVGGLATVDGCNPEGDLVDDLGSMDLTWNKLYVQYIYDAGGGLQVTFTNGAAVAFLMSIKVGGNAIQDSLGNIQISFTAGTHCQFPYPVICSDLLTADGCNPEGDLVDDLGNALASWHNIFVENIVDEAGNICITTSAGNIIITGLLTVDGIVPEGDLADDCGSSALTWHNVFVENIVDAGGTICLTTNAGKIQLNAGSAVNDIDTAIAAAPADTQLLTAQAIDEYVRRTRAFVIPIQATTGLTDSGTEHWGIDLDVNEYAQGSLILPYTGTIAIHVAVSALASDVSVPYTAVYSTGPLPKSSAAWDGTVSSTFVGTQANRYYDVTLFTGLAVTQGDVLGVRYQNTDTSTDTEIIQMWVVYTA